MHPYVYHCIMYNSQDMEAVQAPINSWMDKEDIIYTHTHNGIHINHKKEWTLAICDNIDGRILG